MRGDFRPQKRSLPLNMLRFALFPVVRIDLMI